MLDEGEIVLFFRRLDVSDKLKLEYDLIDNLFIIISDNGKSWPIPKLLALPLEKGTTASNKIFKTPNGYFGSFWSYNKIFMSLDLSGKLWNKRRNIYDFSNEPQTILTESAFTYIPDSTIIGLSRNLNGNPSNYYELESSDLGKNWSPPKLTNIADSFRCAAPSIIYDDDYHLVLAIATDRKARLNGSSEVWVYKKEYPENSDKSEN